MERRDAEAGVAGAGPQLACAGQEGGLPIPGTWDSGHYNLLLLLEPAAMTMTGSAHWGQGEAGLAGGGGQMAGAG